MPNVRRMVAALSASILLSACSSTSGQAHDDGSIVVTVTLSRSGPPGPHLDHSPQAGIAVTVVGESERSWSGTTDTTGQAVVSVPAGDYAVDIGFCPDAPQHVTVKAGGTEQVRFDCVAP